MYKLLAVVLFLLFTGQEALAQLRANYNPAAGIGEVTDGVHYRAPTPVQPNNQNNAAQTNATKTSVNSVANKPKVGSNGGKTNRISAVKIKNLRTTPPNVRNY